MHLAVAARVDGVAVADVDRALYEERSLVKQLAMRRTLLAFPRDLIPAALGSASARVATAFSGRISRTIVANGFATDGDAWLEEACTAVEGAVASGGSLSNAEIRDKVEMVRGQVDVGSGKWGRPFRCLHGSARCSVSEGGSRGGQRSGAGPTRVPAAAHGGLAG